MALKEQVYHLGDLMHQVATAAEAIDNGLAGAKADAERRDALVGEIDTLATRRDVLAAEVVALEAKHSRVSDALASLKERLG